MSRSFDPMSLSCLLFVMLLAAVAAFGIRAVRSLDDGLHAVPMATAQVSADELK